MSDARGSEGPDRDGPDDDGFESYATVVARDGGTGGATGQPVARGGGSDGSGAGGAGGGRGAGGRRGSRTDTGGIDIVPPPDLPPVDAREPPPLGTVMLAVALGQILAAVVGLLGLLGIASAGPSEAVAVTAAVVGFPVVLLLWSWGTTGLLVSLCELRVALATVLYSLAVGICGAGAIVLALGFAIGEDPPLIPFALASSALYVTGPAALIQRFREGRAGWLTITGVVLLAAGAAATGIATADAID